MLCCQYGAAAVMLTLQAHTSCSDPLTGPQILVSTDVTDAFKWCCGACTSTLLEFGENVSVISTKPDGSFAVKGVRELAPFAFSKVDLERPRTTDE